MVTIRSTTEDRTTFSIPLADLEPGFNVIEFRHPLPERVKRDRDRSLRGKERRRARRTAD